LAGFALLFVAPASSSAAVVMVLVFGVLALTPVIDMKEVSIGLAA